MLSGLLLKICTKYGSWCLYPYTSPKGPSELMINSLAIQSVNCPFFLSVFGGITFYLRESSNANIVLFSAPGNIFLFSQGF